MVSISNFMHEELAPEIQLQLPLHRKEKIKKEEPSYPFVTCATDFNHYFSCQTE